MVSSPSSGSKQQQHTPPFSSSLIFHLRVANISSFAGFFDKNPSFVDDFPFVNRLARVVLGKCDEILTVSSMFGVFRKAGTFLFCGFFSSLKFRDCLRVLVLGELAAVCVCVCGIIFFGCLSLESA